MSPCSPVIARSPSAEGRRGNLNNRINQFRRFSRCAQNDILNLPLIPLYERGTPIPQKGCLRRFHPSYLIIPPLQTNDSRGHFYVPFGEGARGWGLDSSLRWNDNGGKGWLDSRLHGNDNGTREWPACAEATAGRQGEKGWQKNIRYIPLINCMITPLSLEHKRRYTYYWIHFIREAPCSLLIICFSPSS